MDGTAPLLLELVHPGADPAAPARARRAVRAVVRRGPDVLMVWSAARGDYKFPGGGVEPHESEAEALRRELDEECGARLTAVGDVLGDVVEHRAPLEPGGVGLRMVSRYVRCDVADGMGGQRLDDYEAELGMRPVWIAPGEALAANRALLAGAEPCSPWVARETRVLALLPALLTTR